MTFSYLYIRRCSKCIRDVWNAQSQIHHCYLVRNSRKFSTSLCKPSILACFNQRQVKFQNVLKYESNFSPREQCILALYHQQPILWKPIISSYSTQQSLRIGENEEPDKKTQKNIDIQKDEQVLNPDSLEHKIKTDDSQVDVNRLGGISDQKYETNSITDEFSKKEYLDKSRRLDHTSLSQSTNNDFDNIPKNNSFPQKKGNEDNIDVKSNKITSNEKVAHIPVNLISDASKSIEAGKIASETLQSRIMRFLFWRYWWYLQKFVDRIEHKMPKTFKMFRLFGNGFKDFAKDFLDYIKLLTRLSLPSVKLKNQSYRNLQIYHYMPWDMLRVSPMLLVSAIPLGQNVAVPIAFYFPRHFLSYHFWTEQQRREFAAIKLKKRLFNARPVFRFLQSHLYSIDEPDDREKLRRVFLKLGSGIHPNTQEIMEILPIFRDGKYHLNAIYMAHVNALLRFHGKSVLVRRRSRLFDHARMIHCMDAAITREGGVSKLSQNQLYQSLFLRGINPTNMRNDTMIQKMEEWLTISKEIDRETYSLLLHLPIFLAYNEPTNLVLIY